MKKIIFSPCLLYSNESFFDWHNLYETLSFINNFLDCGLDTYNGSVYHYESWYSKPRCDTTMMTYFSQHILPILQRLSEKGTEYKLDNIVKIEHVVIDNDFKITNEEEFNLLLSYLYYYNHDCILFVGEENYSYNYSSLNILFGIDSTCITVPLVFNPWTDWTKNFDGIIRKDIKNQNDIFPYKELCSQFSEMEIAVGDKAQFKHYADIVAERNGFVKLPYTSKQYKNVPYYKRNDGEYVICVDVLHGFFEVFKRKGNTYEDYKGEYDFSCNKVTGKYSSSETHICYKNY